MIRLVLVLGVSVRRTRLGVFARWPRMTPRKARLDMIRNLLMLNFLFFLKSLQIARA